MGETCAKCGRKLIEVTRFYEFENKNYCNHCVTTCERCNKLIHLDEAHQLDNHYVCDECFELGLVVCHDCQDIILEDDSYYIDSGYHVCQYCYEDGYFYCDSCGYNFSQDELHQDENNGDCLCDCCFEEREMQKSPYINHHDYDPVKATDFNNDRYDNMYIGVELELENKDNKIQSTKDYVEDFILKTLKINNHTVPYINVIYCKQDGSLNNSGIEVVSYPFVYEKIKQIFNPEFFNYMKKYNMTASNHCGLHFHLDRQYLKLQDIQKIDYMVNIYYKFFQKIGGREFNRYCEIARKDMCHWGANVFEIDRYHAVNLTERSNIELRFYASTNDYDTFIRRLDSVIKIVKMAKKYSFEEIINMKDSFAEKFNAID